MDDIYRKVKINSHMVKNIISCRQCIPAIILEICHNI